MRRVRKSSTGRPVLISGQSSADPSLNIRKSISMDNMTAWSAHNRDVSGKLVETCEEYLDEKNEAVSADHEKESAEFADTDTTTDETGNKSELCENHLANDAKFQEALKIVDENGNRRQAANFSTLPRSFSRGKNISRSLVPKMRKLFEKSRSCDPDLPQVKIRIQSEPNNGNGSPGARVSDGTESARSSFVMLNPGDTCEPESRDTSSISISGSTTTLDDVDGGMGRSGKQRGFVNKCVTKVKSFMGKSQERI